MLSAAHGNHMDSEMFTKALAGLRGEFDRVAMREEISVPADVPVTPIDGSCAMKPGEIGQHG